MKCNSSSLTSRNIKGARKTIALIMRSKIMDLFLIILILLYTLVVVITLAIDDILSKQRIATLVL
jgi:hypothetical protein